MNKLIDTDYLLACFDISEDVDASRLEKNIGAASRRLRAWVTDEVYQSVLNLSDDVDKKEDFQLCEANLAMHFATLGLNTPVTSKGITKASKAKDFSVISYLNPDEIKQVQQMYLEQAEEIVRPYREFIDTVEITVVSDESAACNLWRT